MPGMAIFITTVSLTSCRLWTALPLSEWVASPHLELDSAALPPDGVGRLWVSLPRHSEIAEIPPVTGTKTPFWESAGCSEQMQRKRNLNWKYGLAYSLLRDAVNKGTHAPML